MNDRDRTRESIQAICHHDDGFEHPSDGSLPCCDDCNGTGYNEASVFCHCVVGTHAAQTLEAELGELERTDPDVRAAAESYDRMVERITGRELPRRDV